VAGLLLTAGFAVRRFADVRRRVETFFFMVIADY
jgi:hypothetical protein